MSFTATRTKDGQYFLYNDKTLEHVTVDSAEDVATAIDAYNKGAVDKAAAKAEAAAVLAGPQDVPAIDTIADPMAAVVSNVSPVAPVAPAATREELQAQLDGMNAAPVSNAN